MGEPAESSRSAEVLVDALKQPDVWKEVANDLDKLDQLKNTAVEQADRNSATVRRVAALELDQSVYKMTALFLGSAILMVVAGIVLISVMQSMKVPDNGVIQFNIPDGLIALGSAAVGALAGLLAPLGNRG